jgi:DNA processing protein
MIVSGLASGVDGIAHRAALEAGKRTIAVLGSGIDSIYPRQHTGLAAQISSNGAVISEHPIGTKPKAEHFPRRNRILSGMTLGTLVIEAGESSGALIAARHAVEQNREVFAVPGSIMSPNSRGTNGIIQQLEAKLVHSHEDILKELNLSFVGKQIEMAALFPASDEESNILFHLGNEPTHIDEIIRGSGMTISVVSSLLAMMKLRGLVRQVGGIIDLALIRI